jgi:hypothetical protein
VTTANTAVKMKRNPTLFYAAPSIFDISKEWNCLCEGEWKCILQFQTIDAAAILSDFKSKHSIMPKWLDPIKKIRDRV